MTKIRIEIKGFGESLHDALRREGYLLPSYCGGKGNCGKCRIRILSSVPEPKEGDRSVFSEEELKEGWRLACLTRGEGIFELEIPEYREEEIAAEDSVLESSGIEDTAPGKNSSSGYREGGPPEYALAVDLGTTTIAAGLVDTAGGKMIRKAAGINHQRTYGADVLSRIDAANRGAGVKLQEIVLEDLDHLCLDLGLSQGVREMEIPVVISGNTTMQHLLQGLSCRTLGTYPFQAVDLSLHKTGNMTFLPGISTFVGADIVSGIISCGMDRKKDISILIDLGTNGEMVIGNQDRMLAASASAGPAFEGGNISCGTAGIPGAVESVRIRGDKASVSTIGGKTPLGICGSGVLDTVYELLKEGIIDETGRLDDRYFETGYPLAEGIRFTAKDVREVQLAKSAIRSGIGILLEAYGISCREVDCLYLAGGFGRGIDTAKAVGIGLLPRELSDRIVTVGNSSLAGAALYASVPSAADRFSHVTRIAEELLLANHGKFNDLYIKNMFFEMRPGV